MMKKCNMQASPGCRIRTRIRTLLLLALAVLAAGCSSIRLSYDYGDTLLYWWLDAYVDLDQAQNVRVKKDIEQLFQWHRKTQLKDYAQLLKGGQHQLQGNVTEADLLADYSAVKERATLLLFRSEAELADLARSLHPEQLLQMEQKFASQNDDYRKKYLSGDTEKHRRLHFVKSMEQFELWFGGFSREQEAILRQASDARPLDDRIWLAEHMRRQQNIAALLRKVQQEKLGKEATLALVHNLIKDSVDGMEQSDNKAFFDAYKQGSVRLVLTAIRIATPAQKAHARKRMQDWIDDFNALAAAAH